jgi:hypothetical protein
LRRFSERLHQVVSGHNGRANDVYRDLAVFAAVAWAIQDSACLRHLPADERTEVAKTLKAVASGGRALFFGLPLQPQDFRPAGFYTRTPELAHYFSARRWYATSAFRLKSATETLRAIYLAMLVESDIRYRLIDKSYPLLNRQSLP